MTTYEFLQLKTLMLTDGPDASLLPVMSERLSILVSVMNSTSLLANTKQQPSQARQADQRYVVPFVYLSRFLSSVFARSGRQSKVSTLKESVYWVW